MVMQSASARHVESASALVTSFGLYPDGFGALATTFFSFSIAAAAFVANSTRWRARSAQVGSTSSIIRRAPARRGSIEMVAGQNVLRQRPSRVPKALDLEPRR